MTNNKLKILACAFMLLDHIGYILFPSVIFLRCLGRISLPLFSFLIAEGCFYTKNKLKYLLSVFGLGVICQGAFFLEALINSKPIELYFNILFTFTLSIILCYAFLKLKQSILTKQNKSIVKSGSIFILLLFLIIFLTEILPTLVNFYLYFDYGISGVLLPVFAILFKDKKLKLISTFLGITLLNFLTYKVLSYTWHSYLALIFIAFYNGKRGKTNLKYLFYAFYPFHLLILYFIKAFM